MQISSAGVISFSMAVPVTAHLGEILRMQISSAGMISFVMAGRVTAHLFEMLRNADFICCRDQF